MRVPMHIPRYQEYSLAQLEDCLEHINREKYPERFIMLSREIELRKERGECAVDPTVNVLTGADAPFFLALQLWWCCTWRLLLGAAAISLPLLLLARLNATLSLLSAEMLVLILVVTGLLFFLFAGPIVTMQALARPYGNYQIRIIRQSPGSTL